MATRLPSGKWRAQVFLYTDQNGKRVYESFIADTADEADYAALTFKLGKGKKTKEAITLRTAMEAYINSKDGLLSPATISGYRGILRTFGDYLDVKLSQVNALNLQTAITTYANTPKKQKHNGWGSISPKTVKNAYGLISATLRQNGIRIDGITLPQPKKPDYKTPFEEELAKIMDVVRGSEYELPVLLAAWCSLRRSEILGIKYGDVDFENNTIQIRRANVYIGKNAHLKGTKNMQSTRVIHMPDYIGDLIRRVGCSDEEEFVVKMKGMTLTNGLPAKLKRKGIEGYTIHNLRHTYVSILSDEGVDKKYIKEMGGWSSENGVMEIRYQQTSQRIKDQINSVVDNVFLGILQHDATRKSGENQ